MEFVVPIPEKVSLNKIYGGVHWSKRSQWKNDYHLAVLSAQPKQWTGHFPVCVHYHFRLRGRSLDTSNTFFMAKLIEDGLVACEVLPDDSQKFVSRITTSAEQIKEGDEEVVIHISTPNSIT